MWALISPRTGLPVLFPAVIMGSEIESRIRMVGRIRVLHVFTHHVEAKAGCRVAITVSDGSVLETWDSFPLTDPSSIASTGDPQIELNCVLKWNLQIENLSEENDKKLPLKIGIGVRVGISLLIISIAIALRIRKKKNKSAAAGDGGGTEEDEIEMGKKLRWLPGMAREFKYEELKKATSEFNEGLKLGEGGFGVVYRGTVQDSEIAVKKISRDNVKGRKDDFMAELQILVFVTSILFG